MSKENATPDNYRRETVLKICDLSKDYTRGRGRPSLQGLNLEIGKGEIFGFLGPNGAGKTTTIKALLGLILPDSGSISIFGSPPEEAQVRNRIGYLPEEACLAEYLTAGETLSNLGRLSGVKVTPDMITGILATVKLEGVENRIVKTFSKGMKQRLGMAQALIHDPDLLILDEPLTGLDPLGRKMMKEIIMEAGARGKTVFLSSHQLLETEQMCSRIGILCNGRLVRQEEMSSLEKGISNSSPLEELFMETLRSNGYE